MKIERGLGGFGQILSALIGPIRLIRVLFSYRQLKMIY